MHSLEVLQHISLCMELCNTQKHAQVVNAKLEEQSATDTMEL